MQTCGGLRLSVAKKAALPLHRLPSAQPGEVARLCHRSHRAEGQTPSNQRATACPHSVPKFRENRVQLNSAGSALEQIDATQTRNAARKCKCLAKVEVHPSCFQASLPHQQPGMRKGRGNTMGRIRLALGQVAGVSGALVHLRRPPPPH